jgi:hypothetical protein
VAGTRAAESMQEGETMRTGRLGFGMLASALLVAGCSAQTQVSLHEMQKHGAHFASWSHMGYSLQRGTAATTTKQDLQLAKNDPCLPNQTCTWWGEVVQVEPIQ